MLLKLRVDPATALLYPEGWQSWTPTTTYGAADEPFRPVDDAHRLMGYGPGACGPGFIGSGLLAVRPAHDEAIRLFAAPSPLEIHPIRAVLEDDLLLLDAEGPVVEHATGTNHIPTALRSWAVEFAAGAGIGPVRPAPRVWCSWYQYFTDVTEADIVDNLAAMDARALPVDVVQIDDGYQRDIGDWLEPSERFADLGALVSRIRTAGRRAGIWVAPFLVGEHSRVAAEHPEWLVPGAKPGWNWGQKLTALDLANAAVHEHLVRVFSTLSALGIDYFKLDFLYAGAIPGDHRSVTAAIAAYHDGLRVIRAAVGDQAYLVGCGAPTLASVGLVDAMRVSPDTAPYVEPMSGDLSSPGQRSAIMTGRARQWQNMVLWRNDPDCLLARQEVAERETWAAHVASVDGLRSVSDRINGLDEWGLATTRDYLSRGARSAGPTPRSDRDRDS